MRGSELGEAALRCNGSPEFCGLRCRGVDDISQYFHNIFTTLLRFDQFLFAGSHNSGTGQAKGSFQCAFKNQDLDITEQLEFGIRFFDIDVIFSHALGCNGLETGHGAKPEVGLYQGAFTSTVIQSET